VTTTAEPEAASRGLGADAVAEGALLAAWNGMMISKMAAPVKMRVAAWCRSQGYLLTIWPF